MTDEQLRHATANTSTQIDAICRFLRWAGRLPHLDPSRTYRIIPLHDCEDRFAVVSEQDYPRVQPYKWYGRLGGKSSKTIYAYAFIPGHRRAGRHPWAKMHRHILQPAPGEEIDHFNGNGLVNTRDNLSIASSSKNKQNRPSTGGSSRFKGVCWDGSRGSWMAYIGYGHKHNFLGRFDAEEDAALAYDVAAQFLYGPRAFISKV